MSRLEHCPQTGMGLFLLECILHNAVSMWRREHQRHSQVLQPTEVMSPEHPSIRTLLGSPDAEILKVAEQVYRGESAVVPSILPCRHQDECMRELHQELTKCMVRAGLQGESRLARPLQEVGDTPASVSSHWPVPPKLDLGGWRKPSD